MNHGQPRTPSQQSCSSSHLQSPPPTYNLHAAARVRSLEHLLTAHQRIPVVLTVRPTPLDQARHNLRSCSLSGLTSSSSLFLTHSALQPLACFCSLNTKLLPALGALGWPCSFRSHLKHLFLSKVSLTTLSKWASLPHSQAFRHFTLIYFLHSF